MKRPTINDPQVNEIIADKLLRQVTQWVDNHGSRRKTKERIKQDLIAAINCETDGYAIAKKMDEYKPDTNLVAILHLTRYLKQEVIADLEESWVISNDIKPPALRARVTHPEFKGVVGFVDRNLDHGYSVVLIATETSSRIIHLKWEDLTIIPE